MKNHLLKFFALFIVSGLFLISSCGEDEEVVPPQPATILFNPAVADPFEGEPGDVVATKVSVSAPSGLISLDISKTVGDGIPSEYATVTPDEGSNQLFYDFSYTLMADEVGVNVVFDFVVKEEGTETAEAKESITVVTNSPTARSYTAVLLDAPLGDKSGESFFSTNKGA
ncbi:MAG TPA: hypothetical protein DCX54_11855, partial [Flavobacteriales bacterium]|nr:hypothetical protein [Flavobacteriales bacterium]